MLERQRVFSANKGDLGFVLKPSGGTKEHVRFPHLCQVQDESDSQWLIKVARDSMQKADNAHRDSFV